MNMKSCAQTNSQKQKINTIRSLLMTACALGFLGSAMVPALAQSSFSGSYEFTWDALKSDDTIALSGAVPSEAIQRFLTIRAGENSTNTTIVGKGAPETFTSNSIAGLDALKKLSSGQLSYVDGVWTLKGSVASENQKSSILAVLTHAVDTSDWMIDLNAASGEALTATQTDENLEAVEPETNDTVTEPSDAPTDNQVPMQAFRWAAQKGLDGSIRFSGNVPSVALQNFLILRAKNVTRDTMQIGEGAPVGFMTSALAAIEALRELETGRVLFSDGQWTIYGLAADKMALAQTMTDINGAKEPKTWAVSISLKEVSVPQIANVEDPQIIELEPAIETSEESEVEPITELVIEPDVPSDTAMHISGDPDYQFNALRADGGRITLSGMLPTTAFADYLSNIIGEIPLDRIEFSSDIPDHFLINTITGLKALDQLHSGLLAYENGQWTLVGDALEQPARNAARQMILSLNDSENWQLDVISVPVAQLCDHAIAQFAKTQTILFAPASAKLTNQSEQNVTDLAGNLNKCPETLIYVSGHTDADGPADANMALSVSRAEAVILTLVNAGVDESRLYAVGYGETLPIATNDTRAGKTQNRRIVFELERKE